MPKKLPPKQLPPKQSPLKKSPLSIGKIAERTGLSVSAIRFYSDEKLIPSIRGPGGRRLFDRSVIRRVSFILISQQLGLTLAEIKKVLASLPSHRTPTRSDWESLARSFRHDIDDRIQKLTRLRESLTGCIGCGCLSLQRCQLYNPGDAAEKLGSGPRFLLGDSSDDLSSG